MGRKPAAAEPTQRAVPQAAVKPIFEPVIEPEPEKKLSDVELARLLGNTLPDDEDLRVPRSVAKFGQGQPVTEQVEVYYKSAVAGAVARYTTPKEAGEALLRTLEGQDSELALQLVLEAALLRSIMSLRILIEPHYWRLPWKATPKLANIFWKEQIFLPSAARTISGQMLCTSPPPMTTSRSVSS